MIQPPPELTMKTPLRNRHHPLPLFQRLHMAPVLPNESFPGRICGVVISNASSVGSSNGRLGLCLRKSYPRRHDNQSFTAQVFYPSSYNSQRNLFISGQSKNPHRGRSRHPSGQMGGSSIPQVWRGLRRHSYSRFRADGKRKRDIQDTMTSDGATTKLCKRSELPGKLRCMTYDV